MKNVRMPQSLIERDVFGFFDDFEWFVSIHRWTKIVTDVAGGVGIVGADAVQGRLTVGTEDATDNDEVYLKTSNEIFLFANNKPLFFEARVQYAEANTDDANVFVGFMNAIAANSLIDDGAGPQASFSGFGFYKVDGGTRWQLISSLATTRTTTDLTAALSLDRVAKTAGGAAFTVLRAEGLPYSSTDMKVDFFIDDVHVGSHNLVYTSATEMNWGIGLKNGGGTAELLLCDYAAVFQQR